MRNIFVAFFAVSYLIGLANGQPQRLTPLDELENLNWGDDPFQDRVDVRNAHIRKNCCDCKRVWVSRKDWSREGGGFYEDQCIAAEKLRGLNLKCCTGSTRATGGGFGGGIVTA